MPELPEVETTRCGIEPHIKGQVVREVIVRQRRLRWPVPSRLGKELPGQTINAVNRRGKYLLFLTDIGTVILHLGMSGSLRIVTEQQTAEKHDHVDFIFENGKVLRLRDPRRFGAVLWTKRSPYLHPLLKSLGPEPLSNDFTADYLYQRSRGRRIAVKTFIMDSKIVVGVGNIYASEALFLAKVRPTRSAGKISQARYQALEQAIKTVLRAAINAGGTTLRDFTNGDGRPGYFKQKLNVYGRAGEPCPECHTAIKQIKQNQRASYYCPHCQH